MKQKRGFALLSEERRKKVASAGGRAAWENGNSHRYDSKSGTAAGKKSAKNRKRK